MVCYADCMNFNIVFKINKMKGVVIWAISLYFGIVMGNNFVDKIPGIMETFQIKQPIIQNKFLNKRDHLNLLKRLLVNGH